MGSVPLSRPGVARLLLSAAWGRQRQPQGSWPWGDHWALTVSRVSSEGRMWPQCSPGLPVHLCLPSTAPSQAYVHCCSLRGPVL